MGVHNRSRITKTIKGELVGGRFIKCDRTIYCILPYYGAIDGNVYYFLLEKVGYVYAVVEILSSILHDESLGDDGLALAPTPPQPINFPNIQTLS